MVHPILLLLFKISNKKILTSKDRLLRKVFSIGIQFIMLQEVFPCLTSLLFDLIVALLSDLLDTFLFVCVESLVILAHE